MFSPKHLALPQCFMRRISLSFAFALAMGSAANVSGAAVVFSSAGLTAADVTPSVNAFRIALGPLNPNVAGSFGTGRREINWDGVPAAFAAPNNLPANFFNVNSPRGIVLATPGTGFEVSGATTDAGAGQPAAADFGNIDPSYTTFFAPFSAQRLFTALGSNVTDVNFFVPGSTTGALSRGFGVVFSDVDLAVTTMLEFFDSANVSLGAFFAPNIAGNETFSFLGVDFGSSIVSRVRVVSGNQVLAAGNTALDLVVMDDFIFGEPTVARGIPEPMTLVLATLGLIAAGFARRRTMRESAA